MSGDYSAIAIAVVGVFGTLVAPIVSQRLSRRARQDEFEMQRETQQDERQHQREQLEFERKRACYVALMTNARHYRMELMNYLYAVQDKPGVDRVQLEDARRAYVTSFAEVQLTASIQVLTMIEPFNFGLSKAYAATNYPGDEIPDPNRSLKEVENLLRQLWDQQWNSMRKAMRQDIGVTD